MKYYIIAGEASGDLHASHLIKSIKQLDSKAVFRCWGGDLMQAEGAELVRHYRDLAFMGLVAVLMNIGKILNNMRFCKRDLLVWQPDVLILVDYPGFNLRMAKFAKKQGLQVHYYISPKIWAWKKNRIHQVKAYVDRMYTIFPFETDFYKRLDYHVDFVGNPLMDELEIYKRSAVSKDVFMKQNNLDTTRPIVALLAGSRTAEIKHVLPLMLRVCRLFDQDFQFVVAGAPGQNLRLYRSCMGPHQVSVVFGQTYELLTHAKAALVTSGTATLEAALLKTPQVVCYKMPLGALALWGLKKVLRIKYISLVNILAKRTVVKELIQQYLTPKNLEDELTLLLTDELYTRAMLEAYDEIEQALGGPGASSRAAAIIVGDLQSCSTREVIVPQ